jgi:hypothetical protein
MVMAVKKKLCKVKRLLTKLDELLTESQMMDHKVL